ncbi:helix-turn-helix domain-containing protein [Pseudomonas rhodesiae]|uniref:helix-turn-helix domain-containing protein n=1 Tax=Pseudomonas rhodesiae TaxID=76760 RepID=UPI0009E629AC
MGIYFKYEFLDIDVASKHYQSFDNYMVIKPGERGHLDYLKNFCWLGESFVSRSESRSGWGYETRNEIDGFLISMPDIGRLRWNKRKSSFNVAPGEISVVDQREVTASQYDAITRYTTIYISSIDIFRTLTLLNDTTPKTRICFRNNGGKSWTVKCLLNLVENIFESSAYSQSSTDGLIRSLKEAMITFVLYTLDNNYSCVLRDNNLVKPPTPHVIKRAAEYINDCASLSLTVSDIAVYAGISIRSLQNGFKKFEGITPIEFLRNVRLKRARHILRDTYSTSTPREVSVQCGFSNFYLFSKYYKQSYGESPTYTFTKKIELDSSINKKD